MADTAERAADRARALTAITSAVSVLDYTAATAAIMLACWLTPAVRAHRAARTI